MVGSYQSEDWSRKDLEAEIGRLHIRVISLESVLLQAEERRQEDFTMFKENEASKMRTIDMLLQRCESLEKDLNKALSLADLSKEGANTPNPFPVK
jgi:uncharacterized protein involved in exopolysaccharide biosynthesis